MKDYLNKDERVELLFLKKYLDSCEKLIESWGKRGNLTKEESKALKTALTWGLKGFNSIVGRQSPQTLKTFRNSIKESYVNIQDKFAIDMYRKKLSSDLNDCYEMNKDYFTLVEFILAVNCNGCTKDHKDCVFAEEFEAHCLPEPTGYDLGNCKYAYKLESLEDKN